eukprot:130670-Amphidinium_carterae.1
MTIRLHQSKSGSAASATCASDAHHHGQWKPTSTCQRSSNHHWPKMTCQHRCNWSSAVHHCRSFSDRAASSAATSGVKGTSGPDLVLHQRCRRPSSRQHQANKGYIKGCYGINTGMCTEMQHLRRHQRIITHQCCLLMVSSQQHQQHHQQQMQHQQMQQQLQQPQRASSHQDLIDYSIVSSSVHQYLNSILELGDHESIRNKLKYFVHNIFPSGIKALLISPSGEWISYNGINLNLQNSAHLASKFAFKSSDSTSE